MHGVKLQYKRSGDQNLRYQ